MHTIWCVYANKRRETEMALCDWSIEDYRSANTGVRVFFSRDPSFMPSEKLRTKLMEKKAVGERRTGPRFSECNLFKYNSDTRDARAYVNE